MCLKSAVQLGIPDIISNNGQPITIPELVLALQIHPTKTGYVYRLMRLLVHAGFFATTTECSLKGCGLISAHGTNQRKYKYCYINGLEPKKTLQHPSFA
ncbi:Isoflavone 4'-O-methyltransferase, partial [Mucuna pruriens]